LAAYPLVRDGSPVRTQLLSQCHVPPGGRPVPRAGGAVAVGDAVGGWVQAAMGPQTVIVAGTLRVVMPRPAAGNACRASLTGSPAREPVTRA